MILSDKDINLAMERGAISIEPFEPDRLQPASFDLTLGSRFLIPKFNSHTGSLVDPLKDNNDRFEAFAPTSGHFTLRPGAFALGRTVESVSLGSDMAARMEGKSSLGRLGLQVHSTAGFIDPGWVGVITAELHNVSPFPILLTVGMKFAQICFIPLTSEAVRPYGHEELGSKYQGSTDTVASKYHEDESVRVSGLCQ